MPSAAGGVIDRLVGHSAYYPPFRSLLPQISFRKLLSAFRISANYQRPSSAGGSCGRQTAGHSSCRAQGPRSVRRTLPWLARPLGTASPSTCGLHHCPEIHLRKKLKTHLFGCERSWGLL